MGRGLLAKRVSKIARYEGGERMLNALGAQLCDLCGMRSKGRAAQSCLLDCLLAADRAVGRSMSQC